MLHQMDPAAAEDFLNQAQQGVREHWKKYEQMARPAPTGNGTASPEHSNLPPGY